jgi:transposase-like protein
MSEELKMHRGEPAAMWTVVSAEALIAGHKEDGRTVYRREAKARLVAAAIAPGASVARLAREHGLNANQLYAWIRLARRQGERRGTKARFSVKVGAGLERAAKLRAQSRGARLLPVAIAEDRGECKSESRPLPEQARLCIEIGGARIVIESATVDRGALRAVIDCLRESDVQ